MYSSVQIGRVSAISLLTQLDGLAPQPRNDAPDRLAIAWASGSIGPEEWLCGCRLQRLFQYAASGRHVTRPLQRAALAELARLHALMEHEDWTICVALCVENLSVEAALALLDVECDPTVAPERVRDALAELVYHGRPVGFPIDVRARP